MNLFILAEMIFSGKQAEQFFKELIEIFDDFLEWPITAWNYINGSQDVKTLGKILKKAKEWTKLNDLFTSGIFSGKFINEAEDYNFSSKEPDPRLKAIKDACKKELWKVFDDKQKAAILALEKAKQEEEKNKKQEEIVKKPDPTKYKINDIIDDISKETRVVKTNNNFQEKLDKYWLDDKEIGGLINAMLQKSGANVANDSNLHSLQDVNGNNCILLPKGCNKDEFLEVYSNDIRQNIKNGGKIDKIIVPINVKDDHWVKISFDVKIDEKTKQIVIKDNIVNPMGGEYGIIGDPKDNNYKSKNDRMEIRGEIAKILSEHYQGFKVTQQNGNISQEKLQNDTSNCGAHVVADIVGDITGCDKAKLKPMDLKNYAVNKKITQGINVESIALEKNNQRTQ